jgi:hypothetical protein
VIRARGGLEFVPFDEMDRPTHSRRPLAPGPKRERPWFSILENEEFSLRSQFVPELRPWQTMDGEGGPVDTSVRSAEVGPLKLGTRDPRYEWIEEVMEVSGAAMEERRGWVDFRTSRKKIGKEYAPRSRYVVAYEYDSRYQSDFPILGTIGLTTAQGGEILPMEEMSPLWKLKRPKNGPLIEARSYEIEHGSHKTVFPSLLSGLQTSVADILRDHPELWDEKIIYSYGDEISCRLYRNQWGFEIVDEQEFPAVARGQVRDKKTGELKPIVWRVMRISPRQWFENRTRFKINYAIANSRGPLRLKTRRYGEFSVEGADGIDVRNHQIFMFRLAARKKLGSFWAKPGASIYLEGGEIVHVSAAEGESPGSDAEASPGLWTRDDIGFWPGMRVKHLTLSRPYADPTLAVQPLAGEMLRFDSNGRPTQLVGVNPREILPGIRTMWHWQVDFWESGRIKRVGLDHPKFFPELGREAKRYEIVEFDEAGRAVSITSTPLSQRENPVAR